MFVRVVIAETTVEADELVARTGTKPPSDRRTNPGLLRNPDAASLASSTLQREDSVDGPSHDVCICGW